MEAASVKPQNCDMKKYGRQISLHQMRVLDYGIRGDNVGFDRF